MGRILGEQKNRLQEDAIKKSETLGQEVAKLEQRYQQIKPKEVDMDRQQVLDVYGRIKDWYIQWKEVEDKANAIVADINAFNMKMPDFTLYNQIKNKLDAELQNWKMFMDFRLELEQLEAQEWITFRGSLYKYGDLIHKFT